MNSRIRQIRTILKISQEDFAKQLGLKQQTISAVEKGRVELTERNFENICRTYNVTREWLRTGKGEMFGSSGEEILLDELASKCGLDYREKLLLRAIIEMPSEMRRKIIDWILDLAESIVDVEIRLEETAKKAKKNSPPKRAEKLY